LLLTLWPSLALAATLEVQLRVTDGQVEVLTAMPSQAPPTRGAGGGARLKSVDAAGLVLGEVPVVDPRHRTLLLPDGTGVSGTLVHGVTTVRVPWPEGARRLQVDDRPAMPPPPLPIVTGPAAEAVPLQSSGPTEERLDLVLLGDGYTQEQLPDFAADVDRIVSYLLQIEPYGDYADLFNVWRIDRASAESGVTHLEGFAIERDTAYGCYYGCSGLDRLVCCDDAAVLGEVGAALPAADGILVLVNDPAYGGSGGFTYATSYVGTDYGPQVAAHELGHTLVGLWDEYGYGGPGSGEGPNCSADPSGAWDSWIGTDGVDAYPECSWTNLHRPTLEGCMMRTLESDYCPICRQEAVLAMYRQLPSLIGSVSPPPGAIPHPPPVFEADLAVPDAHVDVRWLLDGALIAEGQRFAPSCFAVSGELTVEAVDDTPWVRDDPDQLLVASDGPWQVQAGDCPDPATTADPSTSGVADDSGAALGRPIAELPCGCRTAAPHSWLWPWLFLPWLGRRRLATVSDQPASAGG